MLNDPDAIRVAQAIEVCFAAIARCEQDLHAVRRGAAASDDWESAKSLLDALEADQKDIDTEIAKVPLSDDHLLDAPEMSVDELLNTLDQIALATSPYVAEPRVIAHHLAPLIARAQLLDAWLEPTYNPDMHLGPAQGDYRDAFDLDGYLLLSDGGLLLRRNRESWRIEEDGKDCLGVFARNLRGVTYIPANLDCDDPNALTCAGKPISAEYLLWSSPFIQANPMPPDPKIALAPLAERGSDVAFVPSECRSKYALRLAYDEARFAEALARALEQGVNILLVPEMALPEGNPDDFDKRMRQLFLNVQADHYARRGKAGQLRLVIAGVLGGTRPDGFHRNYAVAFDANGEQPDGFRQLKLSHWNLTRSEQDRFGITHYQAPEGPLSDPIEENSLPGDRLSMLEIPGVGRTATLICADMSQNNPGDWLSINAVLDWLYAPVMDKSTCWQIADQTKTARPWIVRRSYRSARLTRTLVITTNSMALSRWVNEANKRSGSAWPPYAEAGIGLAIDGRRDPPSYNHLSVRIDNRGVLEQFASPVSDWKPFPLPT
jgi:hypothetical protein